MKKRQISLGLNIIAEGVEEEEQIQFLKEKNAILAQGYYFMTDKK
ncbi:hypothetical protein [Bacillus sp. GB_SG_008]